MRKFKTLVAGGQKYFFRSDDFTIMDQLRPAIGKIIVNGMGMVADKPDFRQGYNDNPDIPNIEYELAWNVSPDFLRTVDMFKIRGAGLYGLRYALDHEIPYQVYPPDISNGIDKGIRRSNKRIAGKVDAMIIFPHGKEKGVMHLVEECHRRGVRIMWAKQFERDTPIADGSVWAEGGLSMGDL